MTHSCPGPVLPAFDELTAEQLAQVTSQPLRCAICGGELELRCGGGHLHNPARTISPNGRARPTETKPRTYKPKLCLNAGAPFAAHCIGTFTPTGPRDTLCAPCKERR